MQEMWKIKKIKGQDKGGQSQIIGKKAKEKTKRNTVDIGNIFLTAKF